MPCTLQYWHIQVSSTILFAMYLKHPIYYFWMSDHYFPECDTSQKSQFLANHSMMGFSYRRFHVASPIVFMALSLVVLMMPIKKSHAQQTILQSQNPCAMVFGISAIHMRQLLPMSLRNLALHMLIVLALCHIDQMNTHSFLLWVLSHTLPLSF